MPPHSFRMATFPSSPPHPGFRVPYMHHAHGAAQRLHSPSPQDPMQSRRGVPQPCSPEPGLGRGLRFQPPPNPSSSAGLRKGGGGGGRRGGRLFCARGLFCSRGCCSLPFLLCCFFPLSLFCSELISVSRFAARGRVVLRSGFRFALRFALLPAFHFAHLLFLSFRLPFAHPTLFSTSLFAHSSNRCPFLSALPLGLHFPFPLYTFPTPPTVRTPPLPAPH